MVFSCFCLTFGSMIRIGFDAKRAAQNRTGLGNYSRLVARILSQQQPENDYHLYVPNPHRTPYLGEIPTLNAFTLHSPEGRWAKVGAAWRSWGIAGDLRRDGIELFHGLSNELPFNIRKAGCRSVVTIHDLIFLRCPQYYPLIDRTIYGYKFRRACKDADRIIAVSEFTKRDIIHYYNIKEDKIDVVYQGCDPAFAQPVSDEKLADVRRRYQLPEAFVLYVGSIEERKNVRLLLDALQREAYKGSPFHVVMVGKTTAYCERQKLFIKEKGLEAYCHFFHAVPFADLPSFYRLASAFVYPSRIEGFGIPMLEALTAGVPAIGCKGSCLEEAGGPGSIYVSPDDAVELGIAIATVLSDDDLRRQMVADGKEYALNFTDVKLSADLMNVYRKVMG